MSTEFPHDESPEAVTQERRDRRQEEIAHWLTHFVENCRHDGVAASVPDGAASLLNSYYWELLEECVRTRVAKHDGTRGHIDRHKIASLFELLIANGQPINHDDPEIAQDLNARCAFYVAINIIASWNRITDADLFVSESFDREHRTWLKQLSRHSEGWPIFSNAATWYLVLDRNPLNACVGGGLGGIGRDEESSMWGGGSVPMVRFVS